MRSSAECYAEAERLERKAELHKWRGPESSACFRPDYGASTPRRLKSGRRPRFSRLLQTRSERCLP